MYTLFRKPRVNERPNFFTAAAKTFRVERDQARGTAAIAELEFFDRAA
jgi:hypothetical protein